MKAFLLIFWVGVVIVIPGQVIAQSPPGQLQDSNTGLKISPAIFEAVVKPGQTVKKEFFVIHDSQQPLPVQIKPKPLDPIEKIIDMGKVSTFNAAEWIEVSEPYHIFSDRETVKLTATITAPKDAEPGGHYAIISVEVMEAAFTRIQSGASIAPRLGILAFITVPGPVERNLQVTNDRFLPLVSADEIIRINPDFKNTGTIHVMQNSKVHLSNLFGSKQVEIPTRIVLPNTIKEIQGVWDDVPLIGFYKAQLKGSYGPEMSPIKSDVQFIFIFRWLPLLVIIIPLIFAAWIAYVTRGRWRDAMRAFKEAEHQIVERVEEEFKEVEEKVEDKIKQVIHHEASPDPAPIKPNSIKPIEATPADEKPIKVTVSKPAAKPKTAANIKPAKNDAGKKAPKTKSNKSTPKKTVAKSNSKPKTKAQKDAEKPAKKSISKTPAGSKKKVRKIEVK